MPEWLRHSEPSIGGMPTAELEHPNNRPGEQPVVRHMAASRTPSREEPPRGYLMQMIH